ncbi:Methyltransferase type 11 [Thalassoporum mexicanum PCC 7367]|uniref:class I SAM-dependent methyltransferase n=1 Tax=Thalassoporum mexicanum TaxID=3457544 RepID=UPI00029FED5D|nr:class I SAM-dependent methyltransferase [Pseudanabaena sp. PCC 7367]AFY68349.1 Methyltransferase type 11 [Pseudanabaena sp. PCC 7367]
MSAVPPEQPKPVPDVTQNLSDQAIDDPDALDKLARLKVKSLTAARGELVFPCIPSYKDRYLTQINALLVALGQNFTTKEKQALANIVGKHLEEGFAKSPYARLVFRYMPPTPTVGLTKGLNINVNSEVPSIEDKYQRWVDTREGSLFGSHADAKVIEVVESIAASDPAKCPIMDIGAGNGRNTFPLAKLGYPVDAIELAPVFVEQMQKIATAEGLNINVIEGNVLDPALKIRPAHYGLIFAAEVIPHFRHINQVELLLARMCDCLRSQGLLLFNLFLTSEGYEPTPMIRELSQVAWSFLVTPAELDAALQKLPLEIIANQSVYDYEKQHLPEKAWPPTNWFPSWSRGRDLFPTDRQPPVSLRWLLCRRT